MNICYNKTAWQEKHTNTAVEFQQPFFQTYLLQAQEPGTFLGPLAFYRYHLVY